MFYTFYNNPFQGPQIYTEKGMLHTAACNGHYETGIPYFILALVMWACLSLKMRPLHCLETSETNNPMTQRHIPEERIPHTEQQNT